jgi:predicted DCC family thiol-disulfide oxidoreductase YuxK
MTDARTTPLIAYDGDCAFCRSQIERLRRWDSTGQFDYQPRQELPAGDSRFALARATDLERGLLFIMADGQTVAGADAVHEIARRLPQTRWAAWLYRMPGGRALAHRLYSFIAANRKHL